MLTARSCCAAREVVDFDETGFEWLVDLFIFSMKLIENVVLDVVRFFGQIQRNLFRVLSPRAFRFFSS